MRFASISINGMMGLAAETEPGSFRALFRNDPGYPGDLKKVIAGGEAALVRAYETLLSGQQFGSADLILHPPIADPDKIICVGLNYRDHTQEVGFEQPEYPTLFARFSSSLVAAGDPIVCPDVSEQFDYEGELVAIIGKAGRDIPLADALDHVAGYSVFNDVSVRDYQFKTSQWTMGKNFDDTGAFGPVFVSANALPRGCRGLKLETRLNGVVVQSANTDSMVFDVAQQVSTISQTMTLAPGDLIVTGTPAGVGIGRKPPLWMRAGDICEVEIESVGLLTNPVRKQSDRIDRGFRS